MEFFGKKELDVPVNVVINTINRISNGFLRDYFPKEEISEMQDDSENGIWTVFVSNTDMTREQFDKFLHELVSKNEYFEITLDSNQKYVSENYKFFPGDDFILKEYVPEKYCKGTGMEHLIGMLFHSEKEEIKLNKRG